MHLIKQIGDGRIKSRFYSFKPARTFKNMHILWWAVEDSDP
jgi:hypothetical protein